MYHPNVHIAHPHNCELAAIIFVLRKRNGGTERVLTCQDHRTVCFPPLDPPLQALSYQTVEGLECQAEGLDQMSEGAMNPGGS